MYSVRLGHEARVKFRVIYIFSTIHVRYIIWYRIYYFKPTSVLRVNKKNTIIILCTHLHTHTVQYRIPCQKYWTMSIKKKLFNLISATVRVRDTYYCINKYNRTAMIFYINK